MLFFVLATAAVGVTALFSERASESVLDHELEKHLAGVAGVAAAAQRGDVLAALRPGDEGTLAYRNATDRLRRLVHSTELNDAFLLDRDGRLLVGVDDDARIGAERFLPRLDGAEVAQAWRGGQPVGTRYVARDGRPYRAAYARVLDSGGRPAALLGVEASADYYAALHVLRERSALVGALCLAFALGLAVLVGRSLLAPIQDLAHMAEAIGEDPSDRLQPRRRSDEFGLLLDSFTRLRDRLRARDEALARRADAALARERALSERILSSLQSGIITVDAGGHVTSFNPAAARILEGEDVTALEARLAAVPALAALLHQGDVVKSEVELAHGGRQIVVSAAALHLGADHDARLVVLDDITERRDLEGRFQARETLAKLGEMSAGVAHEVRNPLNGIRLLLGLLARDVESLPQCRGLVDRAQQEIDGLNAIVSEFLQFARPLDLQLERAPVADIIEGALLLAAAEIDRRRLIVRREVAAVEIRADAAQLKRALLNLVLNAAQASPEGGCIEIVAARRGDRVRISVRDGGTGVDAEVRDRLFTPFVTHRDGGTGLGLAVAQKIANLHGGDCQLEESSLQGSRFTLELPVGS
ncbi:MAG: sensor histidine kinase [Myxococcales bacterium]|nr:sensor histidine kinase [Myxococcales bacterium]